MVQPKIRWRPPSRHSGVGGCIPRGLGVEAKGKVAAEGRDPRSEYTCGTHVFLGRTSSPLTLWRAGQKTRNVPPTRCIVARTPWTQRHMQRPRGTRQCSLIARSETPYIQPGIFRAAVTSSTVPAKTLFRLLRAAVPFEPVDWPLPLPFREPDTPSGSSLLSSATSSDRKPGFLYFNIPLRLVSPIFRATY